jgi:hypothetical protein
MLGIATLSTRGYITDPTGIVDQAIADFCVSQASQSLIYAGRIASLNYLIKQFGSRPQQMADETQRTLQQYLRNLVGELTEVSASIEPMPGETESNSRYQLVLKVTGVIDGTRVNLFKGLEIIDSQLVRIIQRNNGS